MDKIKCISLWQPWASLMLAPDRNHPLAQRPDQRAAKSFETRSWSTPHRGLLLIHAAKRWDREQQQLCLTEPFRNTLREAGFATAADLPRGAILGYVDLRYVWSTEDVTEWLCWEERNDRELAFGNYERGRFAWDCRYPRRYAEPIPYRGQQGLFEVPAGVVNGRPIVEVPS